MQDVSISKKQKTIKRKGVYNMKSLNLNATNDSTKRIKEYLEQSASDVLADKINNGVRLEQDGKILINKKTLDGFMKYATEEARKIAEKGSMCACVDDATVFGWAIHYFEEDSIIEKLYNQDGTEYVPPKVATPKKPEPKKPTPKKSADKPKKIVAFESQMSLFDF